MNKKTYWFDFWKGTFYFVLLRSSLAVLRLIVILTLANRSETQWQTHFHVLIVQLYKHDYEAVQNIKQKNILLHISCLIPMFSSLRQIRAGETRRRDQSRDHPERCFWWRTCRRSHDFIFTIQQQIPQLIVRQTKRLSREERHSIRSGTGQEDIFTTTQKYTTEEIAWPKVKRANGFFTLRKNGSWKVLWGIKNGSFMSSLIFKSVTVSQWWVNDQFTTLDTRRAWQHGL